MISVFFGTSKFGAIVLEKLVEAGFSPALVVTAQDKKAGRGLQETVSPVKEVALRHAIPLLQPAAFSEDVLSRIRKLEPDMFLLAAYGKILPQALLQIPKKGSLNVHPSLLPKYRGASPIQNAILQGDRETGVTIMLMDEAIDHGPILAQTVVPIDPSQNYPALHDLLAATGGAMLAQTIPLFLEGKIAPTPQDHAQATFTKPIEKTAGMIDWNGKSGYIQRQVLAFFPWPGTFTRFQGKILKVLRASVQEKNEALQPGTAFATADKKLAVQTGSGALVLEEVQLEGKNPVSSKEFLLGYPAILQSTLPS